MHPFSVIIFERSDRAVWMSGIDASRVKKLNKAQKRRLRFERRHIVDNKGSHLLGVIPKNNVLQGRNSRGQFAMNAAVSCGPTRRFALALPAELLQLILRYGARLERRYQSRAEFYNHPDVRITQLTLPVATNEHRVEREIEERLRAILVAVVLPFLNEHWRDTLEATRTILENSRAHFRMALLKYEKSEGTMSQPVHTDATRVPTVLLGIEETYATPTTPSERERTALFRCHADGSPSRATDHGGVYYGPGDLLCIRPGVTHRVQVPSCIARRQVLLVFLDPEPN
jgi:hypothetical protein